VTTPVKLSREEDFVRQRLAEIGIKTEKLPESTSIPSCDFRAADEDHHYWIEVKTRTGDEILREQLAQKDTAFRRRTTGYHPTMAGILDDAVRQLDASSASDPSFEIIWVLLTDPGDATLHFEQLVATVFGIESVWDLALGEGEAKRCFFFDESIFFKHKRLDAVVAVDCSSRDIHCASIAFRRDEPLSVAPSSTGTSKKSHGTFPTPFSIPQPMKRPGEPTSPTARSLAVTRLRF